MIIADGFVTLSHCRLTLAALDEPMRPLSYAGYRFPPEIIQHAIWVYLRFTLSFRDVEELLAERGIDVSPTKRSAVGWRCSAP